MATQQLRGCPKEDIHRYHDNELSGQAREAIHAHVADCPQCQRDLAQLNTMAEVLRTRVNRAMESVDFVQMETRIMDRSHAQRAAFWDELVMKRLFVSAAALICLIVIGFSVYQQPFQSMDGEPSAIVDSYNSNVANVIIMETPEQHHTVIWFSDVWESNGGTEDEV